MHDPSLLTTLALPLCAEGRFDPRAWSTLLPGVEGLDPASVREASLTSIVRRAHKALLVLRLDGTAAEVAKRLSARGLDLTRGHASREHVECFLEDEAGGARIEAHLEMDSMDPTARLHALAQAVGLGAELRAVATSGTLVEVGLTRSERGPCVSLVVHVDDAYDAEQRMIAAGFAETEQRAVPALVRASETVLLAGGTWYAYAGPLPDELPVQADD